VLEFPPKQETKPASYGEEQELRMKNVTKYIMTKISTKVEEQEESEEAVPSTSDFMLKERIKNAEKPGKAKLFPEV